MVFAVNVGTGHLNGLSVDLIGVGGIDAVGTAVSRFISKHFNWTTAIISRTNIETNDYAEFK